MTNHLIYALHDKEGRVRYIGRTTNLEERFSYWLKRKEWLVGIKVLEFVSDEPSAKTREKFWITHYGLGNLENKRITGTGGATGTRGPISESHREAVRQGNLNRATIAKETGADYFSEEGRANLIHNLMGNPARTGQPHSEETKTKMSASLKKYWANKNLED